ncbi:MAG: CPBP family intramembrane metalloprotease [Planctomycetaceae bacterium]|nr:CPBP family intramembrane metalloprotease [Planctomycetaceae bacterium]MCB9938387.1 CPBP family intramembrane metalloprotease [Planctomycetaceae bacterium]
MAKPKKKQRTSDSTSASLLARYWNESVRPLVSLAFVAPMIVAYEGGLIALGPQAMRNGADVWLRQLLEWLGFSQYFLLPALTCGLLLGWHHLNQERWSIRWTTLYGMLFESMAFGGILLVLAQTQQGVFGAITSDATLALSAQNTKAFGQFVAYFGAGIYEELMFRVMLFPALAALLRLVGTPRRTSWVVAIFFSSLAFAAAHYQLDLMIGNFHLVTSYGDSFEWSSFLFRFGAGVFFSTLLLARGFGIAAGAHAFYDILVSIPA